MGCEVAETSNTADNESTVHEVQVWLTAQLFRLFIHLYQFHFLQHTFHVIIYYIFLSFDVTQAEQGENL